MITNQVTKEKSCTLKKQKQKQTIPTGLQTYAIKNSQLPTSKSTWCE
jgi:hypothetical protein